MESNGGDSGYVNTVLAEETERVLRARDWSLQRAEIHTAVPASTINRMRKGLKVKAPAVIQFGERSGEDRETWARIALGLPLAAEKTAALPADALSAIGDEIDATPFIQALNNTIDVGASLGQVVDGETTEGLVIGAFRTMRVRGECMQPVMSEGDIIFVAQPHTVRNGDLVIATVDYVNITCKQIVIPDDGTPSYLEAINGEGSIPEDRFVITGVVKFVIEDVKNRVRNMRAKTPAE